MLHSSLIKRIIALEKRIQRLEDMSDSRIIGINGLYMDPDGYSNIDRLLDKLHHIASSIPLWDYHYPLTGLLSRYSKKAVEGNAKQLVEKNVPYRDVAICHSAGSLILNTACQMGATYRAIIIFGGSLNNDMPWKEEYAHYTLNIYNPDDWLVFLSSLIPFHPFGKLGYSGYTGPYNPTMDQINAKEIHVKRTRLSVHYDYFRIPENLEIWAELVDQIYLNTFNYEDFMKNHKKTE